MNNKHFLLLLSFACCTLLLSAQSPAIRALKDCAAQKGIPPKEYIFKQFEQADIVVLGERDHRDTTQYNLILDILTDPRFADQVGYVYTEVGNQNMTQAVNRLLQSSYPSDEVFRDSLYAYYRNEIFYPLWEKTNRIKFLTGIYHINRNSDKKITLGLTDTRFSWQDIRTADDYKRFWRSRAMEYRDSVMPTHFAEMYAKQQPLHGKRKALIITNQPHAINASVYHKRTNTIYCAEGLWLKKRFGEKNVRIILLNWFDWAVFDGKSMPLTDGGRWDAAFELLQCQPFGLDLKDTPYGETPFVGDAGAVTKLIEGYRWQDVADGLIYDVPLYDHVAAWGIEGIINSDFEQEIIRRDSIFTKAVTPKRTPLTLDELREEYNVFHTYPAAFMPKEQLKQLIQSKLQEP